MSHYSISLTIGAYADGSYTHATVSFAITSETGVREMRQLDIPLDADGPYDSPEDMLRALIPHVVEYV